MKKNISKLVAFCFFTLLWGISEALASETKILPYFSLYGEPKYKNLEHFDYVRPDAPKGGRLVLPAYGSFDNFNPYIFKGIASPETAALTIESLGFSPSDDKQTAYPLIAEKFEIPENNQFIGFLLNPAAKFNDGSPVTADDVIFSFKAITTQGSPLYKVYYADVASVKKINNHHVRFYFKEGSKNKELPLILTQIPIFSAQYYKDKDFATPRLEAPLSSGPYKVKQFSAGKFVVLERDKNYWGKNLPTRLGFYNFDEVRYDYYQDTTVTLQALFAGNIDLREEYIAKIWATGYENNLIRSGKIIKEEIKHNQAANLQSFAFNLRRPLFADKRVRQALSLAFNFDWANERLFYNQYKRIEGIFPNTGLEAQGKPRGKELKLLQKYIKNKKDDVFGFLPTSPSHRNHLETRENLKKAVKLLQEAGYDFYNGKMVNQKTGEPLEFEILSNTANGSAFTRVMLPFLHNLEKIGIKAVFRNIETNIFKNRLDNFDFDMAIISFSGSNNPGNELKELWGSSSADINGSFNLIGVKNPVVDSLIEEVIQAQHQDDYYAALSALDRVIRHEYYFIPNWYSPAQRVAYRNKFSHKKTNLPIGVNPFTWWDKQQEEKAGKK